MVGGVAAVEEAGVIRLEKGRGVVAPWEPRGPEGPLPARRRGAWERVVSGWLEIETQLGATRNPRPSQTGNLGAPPLGQVRPRPLGAWGTGCYCGEKLGARS